MKSAVKWALQVVGFVIALAAVSSFIVNIGKIDLYGMPGELYKQYSAYRDIIFRPVVWCLDHLGLSLAPWLKDAILAYMIPTASFWYMTRTSSFWDKEQYLRDPRAFEAQIRNSAAKAERDPDELWVRVKRGLDNKYYRFYRDVRSTILWPRVLLRNFRQMRRGDPAARRYLIFWLNRLIALIFAAIGYFIWNYVEGLPAQ